MSLRVPVLASEWFAPPPKRPASSVPATGGDYLGSQLPGAADQFFGSTRSLGGRGQFAARLLDVEIGVGHGHEGVIPRGLEVGLADPHGLYGGQGGENRFIDVEDGRGTDAA